LPIEPIKEVDQSASEISSEPEPEQNKKSETNEDKQLKDEKDFSENNKDPKPIKDKDKGKDSDPEATNLLASSPGPDSGKNTVAGQKLPQVSEVNGSLNYQYPLTIPPGRNGLQPDVALVYSSQSNDEGSVFSYGWSVNIPYIERINRKGADKLYTDNYFNSSFTGELYLISGSSWGSKVDNGEFLTYDLTDNVWTVKDKKGTAYKFGTNAAERQDSGSNIYKWMLQEVRDRNENYIKYEYTKDAGQIYPYKITYTGNGSTDGIFVIEFLKESRSDSTISYKPGFSVTTSYRIYEIQAKISDTWARKWALAYTAADNGRRYVLNTITETGQDESSNTVSLPVTDFDYQITNNNGSSNYNSNDTNWTYPVPFSEVYIADVNGDAYPDILHSYGSTKTAYLNDQDGTWTTSASYQPPIQFFDSSGVDQGVRIADVNGDGLNDILQATVGVNKAYLNTGSGWSADNSTWYSPIPFGPSSSGDSYTSQLADLNGDGLVDVIRGYDNNGTIVDDVYLNNGAGWTSVNWIVPVDLKLGVFIIDINNDGLADLLRGWQNGQTQYKEAYLGNGAGWTSNNTSWAPPMVFRSNVDEGVRPFDFNGDGLIDLSKFIGGGTPVSYYNNGYGWTQTGTNWGAVEEFVTSSNGETGTQAVDINADGMVDLIRAYSSNGVVSSTRFNNRNKADLTNKITYPSAGTTAVIYKASARYVSGSTLLNPSARINLDTVYQLTNDDKVNSTYTTSYSYESGSYYFNTSFDRQFAGFNIINKTNAAGQVTKTYYHQGNTTDSSNGEYSDHISKVGKLYRSEMKDGSSNIYLKTVNKWDKYDLGNSRNFVKLVRTTELTYDGDADHKDKTEEYTYSNTTGNLSQKIEWGEVTGSDDGAYTDTGTDKFTTDFSYVANATYYIYAYPSQETTVDQSSNKVKETKYSYDSRGNLTQQENWKAGSSYVSIQKNYDPTFGLITTDIDPRGKATSYVYDTNNLYPATVTNALNQSTSYVYDYSLGKPKQITDINSRVFQSVYDGLDRVIAEKQPDLTDPQTIVVKTEYVYTDTPGAVSSKKTDYLDNSNAVDTYTYYDGLNRPVQIRKETEDNNVYSVADTVYNNLGQVYKQSLPYFSNGFSKTSVNTNPNLLTLHTYDPMQRVVSVTNAVGTSSNIYNDQKFTVIDPKGKIKNLYKDAYGNLVKVEEFNSGNTYTTHYDYNYLGNLTKITDASGNIRNFSYDGLGRRIGSEDLHNPTDTTFGLWSYIYDDSSNLISSTNPNNQQVEYTYDDINRRLTENYIGQAGTEVTYNYDSGIDGIGRLTSVQSSGANTDYLYNPLGGLKQEAKTISSTSYQTDYNYDRQGNLLEVTNPDNSKIKYAYNQGGQLETIKRKEATDGSFVNVVSDLDYGPHGQVTYQAYANGPVTSNIYDSTKLYRLTNKNTTAANGLKLQNLSYTYDPNGNITRIVDGSDTNSSKTVDYTYDDLNRLMSTAATNVAAGQSTYGQTYSYDAIGNILTRAETIGINPTTIYTYAYDGSSGSRYANPHAVTSISDGTNTTTFSYDSNGNMITEGNKNYVYDYNNRLIQASLAGGSNTTTTFSVQSGDGNVYKNYSTWSGVHDATSGSGQSYTSTTMPVQAGKTNNSTYRIERAFLAFNTSALPDNTSIVDAKLKVYVHGKTNPDNDGDDWVTVVQGSQASPTSLVLNDYDNAGAITNPTEGIDTSERKDITNVSTNAYLTLNLNNTGKGWISKTGNTLLALREGHDVINSSYTGGKGGNQLTLRSSEYSGTAFDPVLEVTYANQTTINYAYDHEGQRVRSSNGSISTDYPTGFYNTDGTVPTKHIVSPTTQTVATVKGVGASASVYSVHTDHLTGSNVVTNNTGLQEELMDYFPFGGIRLDQKQGTFSEQRKFAGHEYDVDTGLSYMNARYYNSSIGRFISQDPVFIGLGSGQIEVLSDPQLLNSYSYARNNPLAYIDPDGHLPRSLVNAVNFLDKYNPVHYLYGESFDDIAEGLFDGDWGRVGRGVKDTTLTTANVIATSLEIGMTAGTIYTMGAGVAATKVATTGRAKEINNLIRTLDKVLDTKSKSSVIVPLRSTTKTSAFDRAAEHAIIKNHYPGLSKQEISNIAKKTFESFDIKVNIKGIKKYYYDSKNNNLFINNPKQPTLFQPKNGLEYLKDTIKKDINR